MNHEQTPYYDALVDYIEKDVLTFHVPGHQQGRGVDPQFRDFIAKNGLKADITQILGMDDIHRPTSVCKLAQELAADAWGADYTYFLINGSSSGNQTMLMSALKPGDTVLIPRNAHRSTMGAMILSGAKAIFYEPVYDYEMRVDHTPTLEVLEEKILAHPELKAVCFTSPTYYGVTADTQGIIDLAHKHGLLALADEAWGAHLGFHPDLPPSAVRQGADLVVQSVHKLLAGMTQAAQIHLNGEKVDKGRLEAVMRMFLSTSPSCLFLASLDMSRKQMMTDGRELLGRAIGLADGVRERLRQIPKLKIYGRELKEREGVYGWDPMRLIVSAVELGYSGYEVEEFLRYRHNIQVEMSELFNVVLLVTMGHEEEHMDRLVTAFQDLASQKSNFDVQEHIKKLKKFHQGKPFELPDFPPQAMTMRKAFNSRQESVPLQEAVGRVCAEMVTPYPPGIPILCPGEVVNQELVEYIGLELEAGVKIQGTADLSLKTLRVVHEES